MNQNIDTYAYDFVQKLSFNRPAGSEEEKRAAAIIREEIEALGGSSQLFTFDIPSFDIGHCSAQAMGRELEVSCYGCSGTIDRDLKILYLPLVDEISTLPYKDLSDTCVMIHALNKKTFEHLVRLKAAAFMVITGKWYDEDAKEDMYPRRFREKFQAVGQIPGFMISARDALEILGSECETIHLSMDTTPKTLQSQNVIAEIKGTEFPEETVMVLGHYDSVLVGQGAWDNATGAASVLYQYRYFLQNPPKRTLRFMWCGSEEQGLLGTKAYVAANEDLIPQVKFVFNYDMNGTVFGPNHCCLTGNEDLEIYFNNLCKEYGYSCNVRKVVHSSDSAVFAQHGIPAIGISRGGMQNQTFHSRFDVPMILSAKEMDKNMKFASYCMERIVNAAIIPIPVGYDDEMKKKVEEYFN